MITDLVLDGDVSGKDIVRYIRQDLRIDKNAFPIILATGSDKNKLDYGELRALGVNDFISKPVIQDLLLARMEPWVLIKKKLH